MAETKLKSFQRPSIVCRGYSQNGNGGNKQNFAQFSQTTYTDSFTGTKNPAWRDQIKAVLSATTTASGVKNEVAYNMGAFHYKWWNSTVSKPKPSQVVDINCDSFLLNSRDYEATIPVNAPVLANAANKAIEQLYDRLRSFESSVSAGEDLGEIGQTVRLLRDPLRSLRRLSHDVLESSHFAYKQVSPQRIAKALGDTVLEYNFGIKPLVNTITDACLGMQRRDYLFAQNRFNVESNAQTAKSGKTTATVCNLSTLGVTLRRVRTVSVRYKGVWAVRTGVDRRSVNDVLSLRFKDVIPTIWNLIPYSWLADYVSNVGTIADSFSVPWAGVRWCVKTERWVDQIDLYGDRNTQTGVTFATASISPCHHMHSSQSFSRVKVLNLPVPELEIDFGLKPKQLMNVAALILSRIPVLNKARDEAVERFPGLPNIVGEHLRKRDLRVPYPFHKRS